jgi:hypothetical protein
VHLKRPRGKHATLSFATRQSGQTEGKNRSLPGLPQSGVSQANAELHICQRITAEALSPPPNPPTSLCPANYHHCRSKEPISTCDVVRFVPATESSSSSRSSSNKTQYYEIHQRRKQIKLQHSQIEIALSLEDSIEPQSQHQVSKRGSRDNGSVLGRHPAPPFPQLPAL